MEYVYVVEVQIEFGNHFIAGIFSNEEEAEKLAEYFEQNDNILDGAHVWKERVYDTREEHRKQFEDSENDEVD